MPSAVPTPTQSTTNASFPAASAPANPPLPAPNTFDLLPPLHDILLRLLDAPADTALGAGAGAGAGPADAAGALEPSRLPDATLALKRKIQKAREAVERLPDVGRTMEAQEAEMRALEARVARLRGVLAGLGTGDAKEEPDTKMEE